jgi:uncharacterized protein involved in outer membrane biogenesis
MKKFLIILIVLFIVLGAGFAFWLYTWDLNQYLPQISKKLENTVGNPVKIGSLSWQWRDGIVVGLDGLEIYDMSSMTQQPELSVKSAALSVRLKPLLQKKIEIAQVKFTEPQFKLIRDQGGKVHVSGIAINEEVKPETSSLSEFVRSLSGLLIEGVIVENGSIEFIDFSGQETRQIRIHKINAAIKNISMTKPIAFSFSLGVWSPAPNVKGKGQIRWNSDQKQMELNFLDIETTLNAVNMNELMLAVPELKKGGFKPPLEGKLNLSMKDFEFSDSGLNKASIDVRMNDGNMGFDFLNGEIRDLSFDASGNLEAIQIKNLEANVAGGSVQSSGTLYQYRLPGATSQLVMKMTELELDQILPPPRPYQPQLHGKLSLGFNGHARGLSWPEISLSLTGNGEALLTDGLLANLNILRLILDSLQKIPGAAEAIRASVPPQYFQTLNEPYTLLQPIEIKAKIVNGYFEAQNVRIASQGFDVYLSGQVQLSGFINGIGSLVLDPVLSDSLRRNVAEFQYLTDPYGRIFLPLKVYGNIRNLKIQPDMDYIFSKVVAVKGQDIISGLLTQPGT